MKKSQPIYKAISSTYGWRDTSNEVVKMSVFFHFCVRRVNERMTEKKTELISTKR